MRFVLFFGDQQPQLGAIRFPAFPPLKLSLGLKLKWWGPGRGEGCGWVQSSRMLNCGLLY